MQRINLLAIIIITLIFVSGCAYRSQNLDAVDTTNLTQLEKVSVTPNKPGARPVGIGAMRAKALQDIAMGVGAQAGLAYASEIINRKLDGEKKYLDTIYNFNGMMLTHGVLPPVLEEGDNSLNLDDPNTIRVADRTYQIVKQARFATPPPNWREYLQLNFTKPSLPDRSLLPRDAAEQAIWKKAIKTGWVKGIAQAYSIFRQNMARLRRDYHGMILYRKLLQQHMISPPFVSRTELGVTGTGADMRINDQVLRIVDLPELQTNSQNWKPIVVTK